jgi:hypothetical protein
MTLSEDVRTMENIFTESKRANIGMSGDEVNWTDVGDGIVPIGGIVAWCKTFVAETSASVLIPNFQECDGAEITDSDSPMHGMNIPNLVSVFLLGNVVSGATGGASLSSTNLPLRNADAASDGSGGGYKINGQGTVSTIPPYYTVVWVMRIK